MWVKLENRQKVIDKMCIAENAAKVQSTIVFYKTNNIIEFTLMTYLHR